MQVQHLFEEKTSKFLYFLCFKILLNVDENQQYYLVQVQQLFEKKTSQVFVFFMFQNFT